MDRRSYACDPSYHHSESRARQHFNNIPVRRMSRVLGRAMKPRGMVSMIANSRRNTVHIVVWPIAFANVNPLSKTRY